VLGKFNDLFKLKKIDFHIKSWGNTQVNTTTRPLFEETLNIVLECFDKYKHNRTLLPINCLNNYQLIYNEKNDAENLLRDDNQVFSERATARYSIRDLPSRLSASSRILPRVNTGRTSTTVDANLSSTDIVSPIVPEINLNKNIESIEPKEIIKTLENENEKERSLRLKTIRAKYTFKFPTRPFEPVDNVILKRSLSSATSFATMQRKKRIELKPILNRKRNKQQQQKQKQKNLIHTCTDIDKKENTMIIEEDEQEQQGEVIVSSVIIEQTVNEDACAVH
jgi:ribosomal protein S21